MHPSPLASSVAAAGERVRTTCHTVRVASLTKGEQGDAPPRPGAAPRFAGGGRRAAMSTRARVRVGVRVLGIRVRVGLRLRAQSSEFRMAKGFGSGLGMSRRVGARHKACSVRHASLSPPGLASSGSPVVAAICTQERWSARSGRCSTPTERRARRDAPSCCAQRSASLVWPSRNTVFPSRFNNHVQISKKHYRL